MYSNNDETYHTLTSMRNNFLDYGFHLGYGTVITKQTEQLLMEKDSNELKIIHRLTPLHLTAGADPDILIRGRESRRRRRLGSGVWGGVDFASQMATFDAFWALSFTVRMHVLHIKSSALDLKSAANSQIGFF